MSYYNTSYNPFSNIIETRTFPHARTLRTNLFQKILDAFFIFAGTDYPFHHSRGNNRTEHLGLFDYTTLFIPHLLYRLTMLIGDRFEKKTAIVIFCISLIILLPLFIVRCVVSAILTLISLAVILAVHAAFYTDGENLKEKVLQLDIHRVHHLPAGRQSCTVKGESITTKWIALEEEMLGDCLQRYHTDLENLKVKIKIFNEHRFTLVDKDLDKDKKVSINFIDDKLHWCGCCPVHQKTFVYQAIFSKSNTESQKELQEVLALNIGGITTQLEEEDPELLADLISSSNTTSTQAPISLVHRGILQKMFFPPPNKNEVISNNCEQSLSY